MSWHRTLPRESGGATIAFEDFDGDQRRELLVASFGDRAGSLELLDPRTWQTLRLRQIEAPTRPAAVVDVDHDGRPEIVVPSQPRDVLLFDDDFELLRRLRSSIQVGPVLVVQDLDGDAVNEMVVQGSETLLLGPRLQPKAIVPIILTEAVALRRGPDLPRGLVVQTPQGSTRMFVLRRTPFYLARQYGPWAAGPAGTAALLLAGMATVRARRRRRVLETLHAVSRERDGARLLVLDRAGRILWANDAMRDWCTGGGGAAALGGTVDRLAPAAPELAAFCRECIATKPPRDVVAPAPIRGGRADASPLRASARPALTGSRTDPHWVVRLDDPAAAAALDLQAAWAPLARRIAHDLRNPLTSVLLTLKRMQIEYREAAPEAVPRLDAYNERVQERVDHLRRLTSNFLKLLGEERPHCEKHDLNDIVRAAADGIGQGLPPDVRIVTRLAADLPSVAADREQLESVLENLVANAVNAMPHGGAITLATHAATGLDVGGAGPRDYVQLEVLDTGTGIEPADLGLVFDAGFTRGEHGSGLGLAIVRKIVQDHGGYASVESEPGAGTVFTILLPAWRHAAGGPAA